MSLVTLNSTPLNKGTLNGTVIVPYITSTCSGEFNAMAFNAFEMNSCRFFANVMPQTVLSFAQGVGYGASSTVVTFVQSVGLQEAIQGTVVSFAQAVKKSLAAAPAVTITQFVTNATTFFGRYGWDAEVFIAGREISKSQLLGDIVITKSSNQNTLCEFKVKPTDPLAFIDLIDGGAVIINYYDSDGGHRLFTGVVDLPEVDLINKWINVKSSDRREELIKAKMLPLLPTIGRYSKEVQGEITSVGQEMEYRLQTVASDVDFDASNVPNINSWYAKATADFTFTNSDVYYRNPKITWQSRAGIVNDVTVEVKYQYPRLYHYQRAFSWTTTAPEAGLVVGGHQDDYSFPTVGMIKQASDSAGWKLNTGITYEESLSNYWITYSNVIGSNGQVARTPVIHHLESEDSLEVINASWEGSTRFAQTIEETYTLTVTATQSVDQYGSLTAFSNYSVKADYSTNNWESYRLFTDVPAGAVISNDSYYVDEDINYSDKNNAVLTAIDKAKVQILASHRDTVVNLQVPIKPDLELKHTLEIDTTPLSCKGKVTSIKHTLNLIDKKGHTTDINIALFRARGSASTTATTVPAKPSDHVVIPSAEVVLGNHLGYDFNALPITTTQTWNGFVGNTIPPDTYTRYQEKFIVDTPAAPAALRDLKGLEATATYEVAIPNDDLDITF